MSLTARNVDRPNTDSNPANAAVTQTEARTRIPMSLPELQLEAPAIPGYHTHWIRGEARRLAKAHKAGYTFVEDDEVQLNRTGIANGPMDTGNADLGSKVSVVGGADGVPLYLMKLPLQYWLDDQYAASVGQEKVAAALRGDAAPEMPKGDNTNRYSRREQANYLKPKAPIRRAILDEE